MSFAMPSISKILSRAGYGGINSRLCIDSKQEAMEASGSLTDHLGLRRESLKSGQPFFSSVTSTGHGLRHKQVLRMWCWSRLTNASASTRRWKRLRELLWLPRWRLAVRSAASASSSSWAGSLASLPCRCSSTCKSPSSHDLNMLNAINTKLAILVAELYINMLARMWIVSWEWDIRVLLYRLNPACNKTEWLHHLLELVCLSAQVPLTLSVHCSLLIRVHL